MPNHHSDRDQAIAAPHTHVYPDHIADRLGLGRIPFIVRVGVTGHRSLANPAEAGKGIVAAFERINDLFGSIGAPVVLNAISSLAMGADQLLAQAVLETPGGMLEVPLPYAADDYRRENFPDRASKDEFDALLSRAALVETAPPTSSPEEGYERAGKYVVDRCDVLVAVWDGQPGRGRGGTAEVVTYALRSRVPLLVVPPDGGENGEDLGDGPLAPGFLALGIDRPPWRRDLEGTISLPIDGTRAACKLLADYNKTTLFGGRKLRAGKFEAEIASEQSYLPLTDDEYGNELRELSAWMTPYFVRADRLAIKYQRWFYRLTTIGFVAAAMAVLTIATVALFWKSHPALAAVELFFLALVILVFAFGRRKALHDRWLSARFLAERLRSAVFLKAAGLGYRREGGFSGDTSTEDEWLRRAYGYVWNTCPQIQVEDSEVEALKGLLVRSWIEGQIEYHRKTTAWQRRRYTWLARLSFGLFMVTIIIAILHAASLISGETQDNYLDLFAICLPAFGSAFAGISAHHQYLRNANVYDRTRRYLLSAKSRMTDAQTLGEVQAVAATVDEIISDESNDWVGVMKFNDFEIAG